MPTDNDPKALTKKSLADLAIAKPEKMQPGEEIFLIVSTNKHTGPRLMKLSDALAYESQGDANVKLEIKNTVGLTDSGKEDTVIDTDSEFK